jgi:hypothetical protein
MRPGAIAIVETGQPMAALTHALSLPLITNNTNNAIKTSHLKNPASNQSHQFIIKISGSDILIYNKPQSEHQKPSPFSNPKNLCLSVFYSPFCVWNTDF